MLKEYPEYKETQAFGISKIPISWQVQHGFALFEENKIINKDGRQTLLLQFNYGEIVPKKNQDAEIDDKGTYLKYSVIKPGYILINGLNLNYDFVSQRVAVTNYEGAITSAYLSFKCRNRENLDYIKYLLKGLDGIKLFHSLGSGLRQTLTSKEVLQMQLPIPPISEQNAIVKYLDYKTKQIDEFVSVKEKEITLLEEFKRSLISDYVSKGNSQTEMKESGIEWIHKIPKHWKTLMLFQCAEEYFKSNKDIHHQNLLSLSYGKIKRKDINTKGGLLPESFDNYQVVKKGNIILRLTDLQNDHRSLRTGLVTETGIITSAYVCIKPRENVTPEYLHWILHCCDLHKVFYGMGGGVRQSIGYTDISKMYFPIPPLEEQNVIADYLDKKTSEIDTLISSIQKQITLVKELRTKLIADAVTGKIDVREAI